MRRALRVSCPFRRAVTYSICWNFLDAFHITKSNRNSCVCHVLVRAFLEKVKVIFWTFKNSFTMIIFWRERRFLSWKVNKIMVRKALIQKDNPWKSGEAGENPQNAITLILRNIFRPWNLQRLHYLNDMQLFLRKIVLSCLLFVQFSAFAADKYLRFSQFFRVFWEHFVGWTVCARDRAFR